MAVDAARGQLAASRGLARDQKKAFALGIVLQFFQSRFAGIRFASSKVEFPQA